MATTETKKLTKQDAHYRVSRGVEMCANCEHYLLPEQCELVEGRISPAGVCDFHELVGAEYGRGYRR